MTKTVYRIFTIADYDREANYLRKVHQSGWKLDKVAYSPFLVAVKYTFEACEKEEVAYQLDFFPMKKAERPAYFQLFADYGWEHIQNFNDFSYFRKKVMAEEKRDETELYTDARSKLEMMQRIVRFRLLPVLVFLGSFVPIVWMLLVRQSSLLSYVIAGIDGFLLLVLLFQLLHILHVFYQKRKELTEKGGQVMKRRKHFFDLDFAKEEAYLCQMNQEGWALTEVKGFSYSFQESPKEEVVYKMDVMPLDKDEWENYLTIFEEAGWTFVAKKTINGAYLAYFSKAAQDFVAGEEWDIYSDKEAKLAMMKRRLQAWLGLTFLFAMGFLQVVWKWMTDGQRVWHLIRQGNLTTFFTLLYLLLISAWLAYIVRLMWQYRKYKRS